MTEYIFLFIILLLRFPQNLFNKKLSGIVNGSGTYFLYGAYNYLLAGAVALAMMLLGGTYTISLRPWAYRLSARCRLHSIFIAALRLLKAA